MQDDAGALAREASDSRKAQSMCEWSQGESVLPRCLSKTLFPRRQSLSAQSPCALLAGGGVQLLFPTARHTHAQTSWRTSRNEGWRMGIEG
jgi:hypothetical protein